MLVGHCWRGEGLGLVVFEFVMGAFGVILS